MLIDFQALMICFAKEFLVQVHRRVIPLLDPPRTTIFHNCRIEKIDAEIDENDRIQHLIVYTRSKPRARPQGRFHLR